MSKLPSSSDLEECWPCLTSPRSQAIDVIRLACEDSTSTAREGLLSGLRIWFLQQSLIIYCRLELCTRIYREGLNQIDGVNGASYPRSVEESKKATEIVVLFGIDSWLHIEL